MNTQLMRNDLDYKSRKNYELEVMGDESNIKECVNMIMDEFKASGKRNMIIVNIGTDSVILDSFGPTLGSILESSGSKMLFYGTLENPVHALNLNEISEMLSEKHSDDFIIATDACVTQNRANTNKVHIRNRTLSPGIALNKSLPRIGEMSIVQFNYIEDKSRLLETGMFRLRHPFKAARLCSNLIKALEIALTLI